MSSIEKTKGIPLESFKISKNGHTGINYTYIYIKFCIHISILIGIRVGLQVFIELRKELCPELFPSRILNRPTFILGINIYMCQY